MKKLIFLFLIPFILTGCYDKTEADDRNFCIMLGIDKSLEEFSVNFVNAKFDEQEDKNMLTTNGKTLYQTIENTNSLSKRKEYLGHTKTIVFGYELLNDREMYKIILDELENNREINRKAIVVASREDAKSVCEKLNETDDGLFLWEYYNGNKNAFVNTLKKDIESTIINSKSKESDLIPLVYFEEDELKISGFVLLKDIGNNVLISDKDVIRGILRLKGDIEEETVYINFDNTDYDVEIDDEKIDYDIYKNDDGSINCDINIKLKFQKGRILKDEIKAKTTQKIKNETEQTLEFLKNENSDVINLYGKLKKEGIFKENGYAGIKDINFNVNVIEQFTI